MSDEGNDLREFFEDDLLDLNGLQLTIYKNWNTSEMTSLKGKAIKDKNDMFRFPVSAKVYETDVIQIQGSRSFWRVIDVDEKIQFGTITNLNVKVIKIDYLGNEISINSQGKAVFNAPIYGGVQIDGKDNSQTNNVHINSEFKEAVEKLLNIIDKSSLKPVDKIDTREKVESLKRLAELEKTSEVIERANSKIEAIKDVISTTADMTSLGMILLQIIQAAFGS